MKHHWIKLPASNHFADRVPLVETYWYRCFGCHSQVYLHEREDVDQHHFNYVLPDCAEEVVRKLLLG